MTWSSTFMALPKFPDRCSVTLYIALDLLGLFNLTATFSMCHFWVTLRRIFGTWIHKEVGVSQGRYCGSSAAW